MSTLYLILLEVRCTTTNPTLKIRILMMLFTALEFGCEMKAALFEEKSASYFLVCGCLQLYTTTVGDKQRSSL